MLRAGLILGAVVLLAAAPALIPRGGEAEAQHSAPPAVPMPAPVAAPAAAPVAVPAAVPAPALVTPPAAPAPRPYLLAPRAAVLASLSDLDAQNNQDQPFLRYLYYPGGLDAIATFQTALRLHVNLISREAAFAFPQQIVPGLWHVDLRDYRISPKVFDKLGDIDPYFHRVVLKDVVVEEVREVVEIRVVVEKVLEPQQGGYYAEVEKRREIRERVRKVVQVKKTVAQRVLYAPNAAGQLAKLAALSHSNAPIVRADWFLVQSARQTSLNNREDTGTGYYDFLELKDRNDFFKLIGERNDDASVGIQNEIRAVVGDSGVTQSNRQVVRTGSAAGPHWTTLETFDQTARGIAIQNLRRNEFDEQTEEHYGVLANGLPVTFLSDDKGVRQSSVPDKVAGNKHPLNIGNDTRVHVNLACMQCHGGDVLRAVEDDVRPVYTGRLLTNSNTNPIYLEIKRQYAANLDRFLGLDRGFYQDSFQRVTGKPASDAARIYSQAFTNYAYGRVSLETAAAELGVQPAQLTKALVDSAVRQGQGDFRTDPFLAVNRRNIPRLNWEDAFGDTQDLLYGVLVPNANQRSNDPQGELK